MGLGLSFDTIASQFDHQRGLPREALRAWVELVDQISGAEMLRVLEPGIGTGRVSLPLAVLGHHVTGTDISASMLAECEASAKELGVLDRVSLIEADATDLPFSDHQFDLGIIAQLLYLILDWPAVLDELARLVKPGGYVIHLTEPTFEGKALALWSGTWREMIEATGYCHLPIHPNDEDVHAEFLRRWPDVEIRQLASWILEQSVSEAMTNYAARIRPLYAEVPDEDFDRIVAEFVTWARTAFPDPGTRLDGTVTLTALIAST